ncbi:MAG: M56 family metallopeptidase [Verrucomicrobiae bacterium]|nr:M56 family metallopeptidase [Verrucomicrobiae bacterium]
MNPDWAALCHRVLEALGTGYYQGLIVTGVLALAWRWRRGINATTRHTVGFAALLVVALLPAAHLVLAEYSGAAMGTRRMPAAAVNPGGVVPDVLMGSVAGTAPRRVMSESDGTPAWERDARVRREGGFGAARRETGLASEGVTEAVGAPGREREPRTWSVRLPTGWGEGVVGVWVAGAGVGLGRLALQWLALVRLKRRAVPVSEAVQRMFDAMGEEASSRRGVVVRCSEEVEVPMAAGLWRPAVLLPAGMAHEATPDVGRLLRHERAHLERWDDWTNLVQQALAAVYFFHPGLLWLSRRLSVDREIACDDHVLSATRAPREYALLLTDCARRSVSRRWAVAPAAWRKPSQLKERIHMILDVKRDRSPRLSRGRAGVVGAAAMAVAVAGLTLGPRLALAQAPASASASALASGEAKEKDPVPVGRTSAQSADAGPERGTRSARTLTAPVAEVPPVAPVPPAPTAPPAPTPAPPAPVEPPVRVAASPDASVTLERRLEQLERLVETLVGRPTEGGPDRSRSRLLVGKGDGVDIAVDLQLDEAPEFKVRPGVRPEIQFHRELKIPARAGVAFTWKPEVHEEILQQVQREVREVEARVAREVKEAERVAQRELARVQAELQRDRRGVDAQRRQLEQQRRALRQQREALGRQMEQLDRQLEALDREASKGRADEDADGEGDRSEVKPRPNPWPTPTPAPTPMPSEWVAW